MSGSCKMPLIIDRKSSRVVARECRNINMIFNSFLHLNDRLCVAGVLQTDRVTPSCRQWIPDVVE